MSNSQDISALRHHLFDAIAGVKAGCWLARRIEFARA